MDHGQAFTYGRQKQYGLNKNKTLITELQLCACTPDWICTKLKPDLSRRPVPFSFSFDPLRRIKHTASASAPYYERFQRSLWLKRAFRQKMRKMCRCPFNASTNLCFFHAPFVHARSASSKGKPFQRLPYRKPQGSANCTGICFFIYFPCEYDRDEQIIYVCQELLSHFFRIIHAFLLF